MPDSLRHLQTLSGQRLSWRHQRLQATDPLHAWQGLLQSRGLSEGDAFFTPQLQDLPDPEAMQDLTLAADTLHAALETGEAIHIFGDFDADGVCGTAILWQALHHLGARISYSIPHRVKEGHGISLSAVDEAAARGVRLAISVDTGITCHLACEQAQAKGMRMIITDHHLPADTLPPALAILNPARVDCGFADRQLCGTGVAFFLLIGLWRRLNEHQRQSFDLRRLLDRVALATVADAMDLRGVNRILVTHGLRLMSQHPSTGIHALLQQSRTRHAPVDVETISFQLAPCINAAGRMQHAEDAFRLLTSEDSSEATVLATTLQQYNRERRNVEQRILREASATLSADEPLAAWHPDWHAGVVGLVAGRLARQYGKPAAIGFDDGTAIRLSLRGVDGFHIRELLDDCADDLQSYGGHRGAGGASLQHTQWPGFRQRFNEATNRQISNRQHPATLEIDGELHISAMHHGLAERLQRFAPIGRGNPACLWLLHQVQVAESRLLRGGVLRLRLHQDGHSLAAVMFQATDYAPLLPAGATVSLLGSLEPDHWRGGTAIQFTVSHLLKNHSGRQVRECV